MGTGATGAGRDRQRGKTRMRETGATVTGGPRRQGAVAPARYVGDFRPPAQAMALPTAEELVGRIAAAGVEVGDGRDCAALVRRLGYRQLCAYLAATRTAEGGPSIARARDAYLLDRSIQAIYLAYVAHFELALRARLADALARRLGSFAHLRTDAFRDRGTQRAVLASLRDEQRRAQHAEDARMRDELGRYGQLTVWTASELMTLGVLARTYRGIASAEVRDDVASFFGTDPRILESWAYALTFVRNRCAHQGIMYGYLTTRPPQQTRELARCDCRTLFGHFAVLACLFGEGMGEAGETMVRELAAALGRFDARLAGPLGFVAGRGAGGLPGWACVLDGCAGRAPARRVGPRGAGRPHAPGTRLQVVASAAAGDAGDLLAA